MDELFIAGDPRFLSGGANRATTVNYDNHLIRLSSSDAIITTGSVADTGMNIVSSLSGYCGQAVHRGRASYHSRPKNNLFCAVDENPTVGVELETEERLNISRSELENRLVSNWFHFESDSSLQRDGQIGYELITEPLPPKRYRDLKLWTGLQNILVPWVESYNYDCTGLHVHVGLEQFEKDDIHVGYDKPSDKRALGKYLSAAVYYCLVERALADGVFLRRNTRYCSDQASAMFSDLTAILSASEGVKASVIRDYVANTLHNASSVNWADQVSTIKGNLAYSGELNRDVTRYFGSTPPQFASHGVEVNASHPFTVEFRRGKGTLNAVSIHRMVEFTTHVVKYAEHMLRNPNEVVNKKTFTDFLVSNTNSAALRAMATKQ